MSTEIWTEMKHRCVAMVIWKSVFRTEKQRQTALWFSSPSKSFPPSPFLSSCRAYDLKTQELVLNTFSFSEGNILKLIPVSGGSVIGQSNKGGDHQLHALHCAAGSVWLWTTELGFHRIRTQLPTAVTCIVSPLGPG